MKPTDWEIKPRSAHCSETGRPFEPDEEFVSLLFQAAEGLERTDLCLEAWRARAEEGPPPLSVWRSKFQPNPPEAKETLGREDAESELRRLLQKGEPENPTICRLLVLHLERKRLLKLRERIEDRSPSLLIYEHVETQETFLVPEVEFDLRALDSQKEELLNQAGGRMFHIPEMAVPAGAETPKPGQNPLP